MCAVAAFYRGPEVGQAKLELVGGLAGGRHSLSVAHPWSAPAWTRGRELQNEKGNSRKRLPLSGSEAPVCLLFVAGCRKPERPPQPKWSLAASQHLRTWRDSDPPCCVGAMVGHGMDLGISLE